MPRDERSSRVDRFIAETAETDRERRFRERWSDVARESARARRRRRAGEALLMVAVLAGGALLGGAAGGARGIGYGVALAATAITGVLIARAVARRRGAVAWDWELQRHRPIARPADRVRDLDDPPGVGGSSSRTTRPPPRR